MNKYVITSFLVLYAVVSQAQWQQDVRLTNDPANSVTSYNNARNVAASANVVHIVWNDIRDGNMEIYYKRSTDAGVSWGVDTRLTNNSSVSRNPSVTVSGAVVHVLWEDNRDGNFEIYYKCSTDGGVNWGTDTRLTSNSANSWNPSVSVNGSAVHILWEDNRDGNYEIYYKQSTDGGVNWGIDTRITSSNGVSEFPSVSVSGLLVHVAWFDMRDGNDEIYYKRSTDGGVSWGADIRLTNNSAISMYPCISVSGSVVLIAWHDKRDGNFEIYYKRSTDDGLSWGLDTQLTDNSALSVLPSVTMSGSNAHMVWRDQRDGNDEIYYNRSTDGGVSWGADIRLTNSNSVLNCPSIAVSDSAVHVVWHDNRDGNNEIYYKNDPTGNIVGK
jgi:hypothetical protein